MNPSNAPYENRTGDFYYRNERGGSAPLQCTAHLHVQFEFFYLLRGRTNVYIDSARCTAGPGDLVIAFPNQIHRFETLECEQYHLFIIHPDMIPELKPVFGKGLPVSPLLCHADRYPALAETIALLAEVACHPTGPLHKTVLRGLLLAFFGQLAELLPLSEARTEDSHAIRAIVDFCAENFTSDLSLASLEDALHLSRYYISHLFSHKLNIRFNDYINSLRVADACRMLSSTDQSVTEIGTRAGFGTLRTFNRSFMKQMGLSPTDYRRRCRAAGKSPALPPSIPPLPESSARRGSTAEPPAAEPPAVGCSVAE